MTIVIAIDDISILDKYKDILPIQKIIQYNNDELYCERFKNILKQIDTKYVLINHDSNILVESLDVDALQKCLTFMDTNSVDQMRLSDS